MTIYYEYFVEIGIINILQKSASSGHVETYWGPLYLHGLTVIPTWMSNYIYHKVWDEITHPFPNFNGCTVEVREWISNFIPYFTMYVITYAC